MKIINLIKWLATWLSMVMLKRTLKYPLVILCWNILYQRLFDVKKFELNQLHFGMYYQPKSRINPVLKKFPFNGDCINALFTILKSPDYE